MKNKRRKRKTEKEREFSFARNRNKSIENRIELEIKLRKIWKNYRAQTLPNKIKICDKSSLSLWCVLNIPKIYRIKLDTLKVKLRVLDSMSFPGTNSNRL